MSNDPAEHERRSIAYIKLAIVGTLTLLLAALVLFHVDGINGPSYWRWRWREPRIPPVRWYLALLLAATPAAVGAILAAKVWPKRATPILLIGLMLTAVAMRLASAAVVRDTFDTSLIVEIVKSPIATSYFGDAGYLSTLPEWLAQYPDLLYYTSLHTQSKPPGPVAYWIGLIRLFGYNDRTALIGAIGLGVLGSLAIPAVYWLLRTLTGRPRAALVAAGWVALAPGCTLFFPMFDPFYVIFTCGLLGFWHLATLHDDARYGVLFGLVLAIATFWTYLVLILGILLLLWGLLTTSRPVNRTIAVTIRQAAIATGICLAAYLLLAAMLKFDPIATFRSAWANQQLFLQRHESARVYPITIVPDLMDFLLGSGWIIAVVLVFALARRSSWTAATLLCVAQPIFVAATGLVQTETARVWMFMLPLWLVPAALELERWPHWMPAAVLSMIWLLSAVIGQNMTLLAP